MKRFLLLALLATSVNFLFGQYTVNGNASQDNCHCYTLTQAVNNQHGSVWNNNKINLTQSFTYTFDVFLGCQDVNGADGITFVMQPISTSIGGSGNGMGFSGIDSSIGVTLDTYQNSIPDCDPTFDHIGIQLKGKVGHCIPADTATNVAGPIQASSTSANIEDCIWHTLKVIWDAPSKTLSAYFDGVFRVSRTQDFIATVLNGNQWVYWGFTGATGGLNNLQKFCTKLTPAFHFLANQKRCAGIPISFIDSTISFAPLAKFYWNFGDGSPLDSVNLNPVHTYLSAGVYSVTQTAVGVDGCIEINPQTVLIGSKPNAGFSWNNVCIGNAVNFTDTSTTAFGTINNWYWDLGDGNTSNIQNPSENYISTGFKTVRLAVKSLEGCESDTTSHIIEIYPKPLADFSFINNQCQGATVQFNDLSSVTTGNVTGWSWDFNNGNTSNLQNPTSPYPNPGLYNVSLTVTSNHGCTGIPIIKQLTIRSKPIAYFKFNTICQSSSTTLTDSSYSTDGAAITQWWWDLGNGQFSNSQNPSVTYNTAGIITVRLVVTSVNGCPSDTLVKQLNVEGKPVAKFGFSIPLCVGVPVQFSDSSTVTGGIVTSWYWTLGDGNTSVLQNPSEPYATAGPKTVKLTVKSLAGCQSDTSSRIVQIYANPTADFTFLNNQCQGATIQFTDQSVPAGTINGWNWDFNNGNTSTLQNPSSTYASAGIYNVSLSVTSIHGCNSVAVVKPLTLHPKPIAYFKYNAICEAFAVTLTDSSYSSDGSAITQWWWDLGNGQFSTSQNPSVTYNSNGTITIRLVVTSGGGCVSDTLIKQIVVQAKPIAKFGYSPVLCQGVAVQFTDSSTVSGGSISQWAWINNGVSWSSQQNPTYTYLSSGNQVVGLQVKSMGGCMSDTLFKSLFINSKPVLTMNFNNACKLTPVSFDGTDVNGVGIANWKWTFGDGGTANTMNALHTYNANGQYPVQLYGISNAGCLDTILRNITIYGTNAFAGNDTIAAAGQPVQLNATGGISYLWNPISGLNNPAISNPVATVYTTTTFTVKAFTPQGCESFAHVTIKIYKGPDIYLPNAFTPNGDGLNDVFRGIPVGLKQFNFMKIYNRWGQEIFSTTDYRKGWDGSWKGQNQENGFYVVMVNGIDFNGKTINKKATVMLIR